MEDQERTPVSIFTQVDRDVFLRDICPEVEPASSTTASSFPVSRFWVDRIDFVIRNSKVQIRPVHSRTFLHVTSCVFPGWAVIYVLWSMSCDLCPVIYVLWSMSCDLCPVVQSGVILPGSSALINCDSDLLHIIFNIFYKIKVIYYSRVLLKFWIY